MIQINTDNDVHSVDGDCWQNDQGDLKIYKNNKLVSEFARGRWVFAIDGHPDTKVP